MKNVVVTLLATILSTLLITGCDLQIQSLGTSTATLEPTKNPTSPAIIKPIATFLPTFTPAPFFLTSLPTQTWTPIPRDIFDNFQGLSGNCRSVDGIESLMKVGYDLNGEVHITSIANVSILFDRDEYVSGDLIKISISAVDSQNYPQLMTGIVVKAIVESPTSKRYSYYLYDDGSHGDQKDNDGIYTNTFNKSLDPGIYKFYFRLSGHDKNTGKAMDKECFLAKTVSPIPTPTPTKDILPGSENKSCSRIEASTPTVVRSEGVGGNDLAEYGRWAHYPEAVSLGDKILAVWQVGSKGQNPDVYMRLLDKNVKPIGTVKPLFERTIVGFTTLIHKENNAVFSYCGHYNIGGNRTTSAVLDSDGNVISEQVRSPTNLECGTGPQTVWTGSRMLFYSWSNVIGLFDTFLDVADTNGNSIAWRKVPYSGLSAIGYGNVLTSSTRNSESSLVIHRLDLEGNDLGELTTLEVLTYEVDGKIVVGYFREGYMVPTADGWMIIASLYAPGIYVAHLAPNGSLISEPIIVGKNLYFANGLDDVIAHNNGAAILGVSHAFGYSTKTGYISLFISGDGAVQQWYPKEDEQPIFGSFFEHQDRLFLIYTSKSTKEAPITNEVLIRELSCRH